MRGINRNSNTVSLFLFLLVLGSASYGIAQTGRGIQTFVPSESQIKLEEAMGLLSQAERIEDKAMEAETLMREAIQLDPKQKRAYYNLAVLLIQTDRASAAGAVLDEALQNNPNFGDALGLRAYLQGPEPRAEGIAYLNEALQVDSMSTIANNHKAKEALQQQKWADAVLHSRMALVGNPESINAYLNMGMAYYSQNQLDLALLVIRSGLRHDATNASLLNLEGLTLLKKDEVKEALARFNKAVTHHPGNFEAQMNAGALTMNYSDFESAFGHFDAASQIRPNDTEALLSRGVSLRGLERYDEAEAAFQSIGKQFPDDHRAQYNLCILYQEHITAYEKALIACDGYAQKIGSDHPKSTEMQKRTQGIRTMIEAMKDTE